MATYEADLAILMPALTGGYEKFGVRYGGLTGRLALNGVDTIFVESHSSFNEETALFADPFTINHEVIADSGRTHLVRDLTMPKDRKPLYDLTEGIRLAHHPETNAFLADKARVYHALPNLHPATAIDTGDTIAGRLDEIPGERVIVKPTRGMASQGVQVVKKRDAAQLELGDGMYMLQEFIDTSAGIPELGIDGVHNVRILSIGNAVVGSIARIGGSGGDMLRDDTWGEFIDNDRLPESMHAIAGEVHNHMATLPGDGQNVIAIDVMRGINASGEQADVLCELNRRPIRISKWDIITGTYRNEQAVRTIAQLWDHHEAGMLAGMVE